MRTVGTDFDQDPGGNPYEECSYCGKSIFPGVAECPYCKNFTDGKGPLSTMDEAGEKPRLKPIYIISGWLVLIALIVPLLYQLWIIFKK